MRHPVLREFESEAALPAPVRVLPPPVRQHFLRGMVFPDRDAVGLDHRLRRRAAVQVQVHHVARVVVQERDGVGVLAAQPEREDVRLPHLVRRRPLKMPRAHQVAAGFHPTVHEVRLVERLTDGLRARLEEKPPAQAVGDPFHPKEGVPSLQFHDLLFDRARESSPRPGRRLPLEPQFPVLAVIPQPRPQRARADTRFLTHQLHLEALFKVEFHRSQLLLLGVALAAGAGSAPAFHGLFD